ncbi:MAG: hypothetical protein R2694_04670 [Ilumatobacteraceae bacterium]
MLGVGARLGAFAMVLAGTFGTAYTVGEKLPGHSHTAGTHNHSLSLAGPLVPGYTYADYVLRIDQMTPPTATAPGSVTFHLEAPDNTTVTAWTLVHEADLHAMVLRPDLSGFRHLHPAIAADGTWQMEVPAPGPWQFTFEATPAERTDPVIVGARIDDGEPFEPSDVPAAADTVTVATLHGDLTITREDFNFWVEDATGTTPDGLEPYLGAAAHLVAMRQGDLAYLHLHPVGEVPGVFQFQGVLEPGATYRLFLQFGYLGEVISVAFTVEVPS